MSYIPTQQTRLINGFVYRGFTHLKINYCSNILPLWRSYFAR